MSLPKCDGHSNRKSADGLTAIYAPPMKSKPTKAGKPPPPCPECGGSSVVLVIHGIPTAAQAKKIAQGQAVAADREEWEGLSEWYCNTCGCDWSRHSRRFKKPGGVNATRGD
jgi:hypothetical protein